MSESEGFAVVPVHVTEGNQGLMDEYCRMSVDQGHVDFPSAVPALNETAMILGQKMIAENYPLHVPTIGTDAVKGRDDCGWTVTFGPRRGCLAAKKQTEFCDGGLRAVVVRVYDNPAVDFDDNYAPSSFFVGLVLCLHYSSTK